MKPTPDRRESLDEATALIDLDAIRHNFNVARQCAPGASAMAVVKADAYGHGAVQVARALDDADGFGVARVSEAVRLRDAGVRQDVCLLEGVMTPEQLRLACEHRLDLVVHDAQQLELLESADTPLRIWLKFDTGMGRLGFAESQAEEVARRVAASRLDHHVHGLMTHLANADDPSDDKTSNQVQAIARISASLRGTLDNADVLSIANSAGLLVCKHLLKNVSESERWIRPGLMLYGASPVAGPDPLPELRPAMTFTAPVVAVRELEAGQTVSYGGIWRAPAKTRVAVVAAGYGDGYPREVEPGTQVLLGGGRRSIVGRVCMDMLCVALEAGDSVSVGDRATLWGGGLPIEEVAHSAGTIPYTLMCGVAPRVARIHNGAFSEGERAFSEDEKAFSDSENSERANG